MRWRRFTTVQQTWWRDEDLRFLIRHRREDDQYVLYDHEDGSRVSFWPSLRAAQYQACVLAGIPIDEDDAIDRTPASAVLDARGYADAALDAAPALGELHPFYRHPYLAWRYDALVLDGFSFEDAERLALLEDEDGDLIDYRLLASLVASGCDLSVAEEIVR